MSLREGQERVEIRPGAFVWMDAAAKKAHEARIAAADAGPSITTPKAVAPETASVTPSETAVLPAAKAKKA